jgi:hypothetical protein
MGVLRGPGFEYRQQHSPQHQPLSEEASYSAVADPGRITYRSSSVLDACHYSASSSAPL